MNIKEAIEYVKHQIETGNLIRGYTDIYLFADEVMAVLAELEKRDNDIHRIQELLDISDANNFKKSKIIDLMAERLTTDIHSKEWVIDYYEKEVEK